MGIRLATRAHVGAFALVCLLSAFPAARGQEGNAEIGVQGYYMTNNGQTLSDTAGVTFRFRNYLEHVGLLSGSFEGYRRGDGYQSGDNFIELRSLPRFGWGWVITGGDFRFSPNLVDLPLQNLPWPEISASGFKIEGVRGRASITFFMGEQTLTDGPRISVRVRAPQRQIGASYRRKIGGRVTFAVRYLRFDSSMSGVDKRPELFPENRAFLSADTLTLQSSYALTKQLQLYAEASTGRGERVYIDDAEPARNSVVAGAAYESGRFSLRANFVRQSNLYLPVLGYFLGDRRGPYLEARLRPLNTVEVFGSVSRYSNNLENDPRVATYSSVSTTGGTNVSLPWRLNLNAQLTTVRFTSILAERGEINSSSNRQLIAGLNRSFGRHNLRVGYREITVRSLGSQRQRSTELEDNVHFGPVFISSSVRAQESSGSEKRQSLFYRGGLQARIGLLTAFAHVELGNDFANETVFATNSYRTTMIGLSGRISSGWNFQTEAIRNNMTMEVNPASAFVLAGAGVPVSSMLGSLNQWSLLVRLVRRFNWGTATAPMDLVHAAEQTPPGSVEGFVFEAEREPRAGVPAVTVTLDGAQSATTDETGHFRFPQVAEGTHRIAFATDGVPADFNPSGDDRAVIAVRSNRISRADLSLIRLTSLAGRVEGPAGVSPETIAIRLLPTDRYTTPKANGDFAFYNLPAGEYRVELDSRTLPENGALTGPAEIPVAIRHGAGSPGITFTFRVEEKTKPIRKVVQIEFGEAVFVDQGLNERDNARENRNEQD